MNWWLILVIATPFLFLMGTILNALKEQKRFEQGALQEILKKRHHERQEYLKKNGNLPPDPFLAKNVADDSIAEKNNWKVGQK